MRDALFTDQVLARNGITPFSAGVDEARRTVRVEVAAADSQRARAQIRRRYGDRVDVDVVAASAFVVDDVPWESWTDEGGTRLSVWLVDHTDGAELSASCDEADDAVVVTVGGPRWQGPHHDIRRLVRKGVELERPLGRRRVIDGATGQTRPSGAPRP